MLRRPPWCRQEWNHAVVVRPSDSAGASAWARHETNDGFDSLLSFLTSGGEVVFGWGTNL